MNPGNQQRRPHGTKQLCQFAGQPCLGCSLSSPSLVTLRPSQSSAAQGARIQLAAHAASFDTASTSRTSQRTLETGASTGKATIPALCGQQPKAASWAGTVMCQGVFWVLKAAAPRSGVAGLHAVLLLDTAAGYGNAIILTCVAVGTPELVTQRMDGQPLPAGKPNFPSPISCACASSFEFKCTAHHHGLRMLLLALERAASELFFLTEGYHSRIYDNAKADELVVPNDAGPLNNRLLVAYMWQRCYVTVC